MFQIKYSINIKINIKIINNILFLLKISIKIGIYIKKKYMNIFNHIEKKIFLKKCLLYFKNMKK